MLLSMCIPTMNRWDNFLSIYIPKYLENPYIGEIVISDENGEDAKKIRENISDPRVKVFVNEKRLGGFRNKMEVVSHASLPWVCLMDSDNYAPMEYFDAWSKVFNPDDLTMVYAPSMTYSTHNHPGFNWRHMIPDIFTPENFKEMAKKHSQNHQLNAGNYIVSKEQYMKAVSPPDSDLDVRCHAFDVQYKYYLLFTHGASMRAVDGMGYIHNVHDGSYFMNEGRFSAEHEIYALYQ